MSLTVFRKPALCMNPYSDGMPAASMIPMIATTTMISINVNARSGARNSFRESLENRAAHGWKAVHIIFQKPRCC